MVYGIGMTVTHSKESYLTMVDKHLRLLPAPDFNELIENDKVAQIRDLPITVVNNVLYSKYLAKQILLIHRSPQHHSKINLITLSNQT